MKCSCCPRDSASLRLRAVENFGLGPPFLIETVALCENCALVADDVL